MNASYLFDHLASAAALAISALFCRDSAFALAFPPFFPNATAAGSFPLSSGMFFESSASPTLMSTMSLPSWLGSRGRVGFFCIPLSMPQMRRVFNRPKPLFVYFCKLAVTVLLRASESIKLPACRKQEIEQREEQEWQHGQYPG
jgi:hypothetical protein